MADQTQSAQEVFDGATQSLSQGKAAEAVQSLEAIRSSGVTSADTEGNLGHALAEKGELGAGISHLTNAIAIDRIEPRYRNDLRVAQAKVESQMGSRMSHPVEWGNRIGSYLRPSELLFLSNFFLLGGFAILLFVKNKKMRFFSVAIFFAALFATASGFARYGRSVGVLIEAAELHGAPISSSETIQSLPSGTRLRIIRTSGEFAEVERPGSFRGWIVQKSVARSPY